MLTFHDIKTMLDVRIKDLREIRDNEAKVETPDWYVVNTYTEIIKELETFRSEILRRYRKK